MSNRIYQTNPNETNLFKGPVLFDGGITASGGINLPTGDNNYFPYWLNNNLTTGSKLQNSLYGIQIGDTVAGYSTILSDSNTIGVNSGYSAGNYSRLYSLPSALRSGWSFGAILEARAIGPQPWTGGNIGAYTLSVIEGEGTVQYAHGLRSISQIDALASASAAITNSIALYANIRNYKAGATITNAYGLYIDTYTETGTITNKYGIYQAGANQSNYFAGPVNLNSGATGSLSGTASYALAGGSGGLTPGTDNYLPKWSSSDFVDSLIYDDGNNVGINTNSPAYHLDISGSNIGVRLITNNAESASLKFIEQDDRYGFGFVYNGSTNLFDIVRYNASTTATTNMRFARSTGDITIYGDAYPSTTNTYDFGLNTSKWRTIFAGGVTSSFATIGDGLSSTNALHVTGSSFFDGQLSSSADTELSSAISVTLDQFMKINVTGVGERWIPLYVQV